MPLLAFYSLHYKNFKSGQYSYDRYRNDDGSLPCKKHEHNEMKKNKHRLGLKGIESGMFSPYTKGVRKEAILCLMKDRMNYLKKL